MEKPVPSYGIFTSSTDIGSPAHTGSASYHAQEDVYILSGSGENMWFNRDELHFLWKKHTGNAVLYTLAELLDEGTDPHRKAGLMVRESLEPGSPYVSAVLHADGLVAMQYRTTWDGDTYEQRAESDSLNILQIITQEDSVIVQACSRGNPLSGIGTTKVRFTDSASYYIGLFVCAHREDQIEKARFTNTRLTIPAKKDFIPYTDYIGSRLEVIDVETGRRNVVFESELPIEAPNWSRDGQNFIVNAGGLLYRIPLRGGSAEKINTGFATSNNNDHGISPDGNRLVISHHAEDRPAGKNSTIYTLPLEGGDPVRITQNSPSYWHGWSPDGKYLIYTAERNGNWNIYRIPASGGKEIPLTENDALDDGSEYSSDGKKIWFNSNRTGSMEIWKMNADGSDPVQITSDAYQNWFPHEAPAGDKLVYLAYPPDVGKWDHPYYRHVMLKIFPLNNGEISGPSRVLAHLYGGQGTINVHSWSPDGKKLAFVSNTGYPY